jgi:hypothetical protein
VCNERVVKKTKEKTCPNSETVGREIENSLCTAMIYGINKKMRMSKKLMKVMVKTGKRAWKICYFFAR